MHVCWQIPFNRCAASLTVFSSGSERVRAFNSEHEADARCGRSA